MKIPGRGAGRGPKNNCFIKPFFPGRIVKIINYPVYKKAEIQNSYKVISDKVIVSFRDKYSTHPRILRFTGLIRYQNVINTEMHFFMLLEISRKIKKFEIKGEKVWRKG